MEEPVQDKIDQTKIESCTENNTSNKEKQHTSHHNGKKREIWIDVVRGITILLVIYSHLIIPADSKLNSIFITTRMPLFFFISGFFMYSVDFDLQLLWRRLNNRLMKQLYPTILLFSIAVITIYNCDFWSRLFDNSKAGYWFTYVSVLYFVTLAPILFLFSKYKAKEWMRISIFVGLIILSMVFQSVLSHFGFFDTNLSQLLSFRPYISYFRFIVCGCAFRILLDKYNSELMRWSLFIISLLCFFICIRSVRYLTGFFGIYIMLFTIYKLSLCINNNNKVVKWLSFVGTMTLEIYLLHYFLIWTGLKQLSQFIYIKEYVLNTPLEFIVFISMAVIVAFLCLAIVKLLKQLQIYKLIFGKK